MKIRKPAFLFENQEEILDYWEKNKNFTKNLNILVVALSLFCPIQRVRVFKFSCVSYFYAGVESANYRREEVFLEKLERKIQKNLKLGCAMFEFFAQSKV